MDEIKQTENLNLEKMINFRFHYTHNVAAGVGEIIHRCGLRLHFFVSRVEEGFWLPSLMTKKTIKTVADLRTLFSLLGETLFQPPINVPSPHDAPDNSVN